MLPMRPLLRRLLPAFALALALGAGAHAQSRDEATVQLPVWNQASGKVEAVLLLEPADGAAGARWHFGDGALETVFGLRARDSLGLLCDRKTGIANTIGNLANHCMVATLGGNRASSDRRINATTSFVRGGSRLGLNIGNGEGTIPSWLSPTGKDGRIEQNDLTLFGEKNIGREGFVSIGGTVAKARLVPASDVPALADRWNARSLSIGGGYGPFSGNIIGRVIDVPGQTTPWQGLGLGFTWRTPWSGQLTVGADNIVTRGKNPFAAPADADDQGTVPYVRYEQDL
jgi:hypothetical protein